MILFSRAFLFLIGSVSKKGILIYFTIEVVIKVQLSVYLFY